MIRNRPNRFREGISMVEILLVILILGLVAVPLHRYLTSSGETVTDVCLHQIAASISSNQMEVFRNKPYSELARLSEMDLPIPPDFEKKLTSRVRVEEIIPGALLKIMVNTRPREDTRGGVTLLTLVSNQRPVTGFPRR